MLSRSNGDGMQFYDAITNWRRIKPHLSDAEFNRTLAKDFNKFTYIHDHSRVAIGIGNIERRAIGATSSTPDSRLTAG